MFSCVCLCRNKKVWGHMFYCQTSLPKQAGERRYLGIEISNEVKERDERWRYEEQLSLQLYCIYFLQLVNITFMLSYLRVSWNMNWHIERCSLWYMKGMHQHGDSEKHATAFGCICVSPGTKICIWNNINVLYIVHNSKMSGQELSTNSFHHWHMCLRLLMNLLECYTKALTVLSCESKQTAVT